MSLLAALAGCAAHRAPVLIDATGASQALPAWLADHPIPAGENIRADVVSRTPASSAHVIQIRNRETPHLHAEHDAHVLLLAGQGTVFLDGRPQQMGAGDAVAIPRGVPHYFVNTGPEPAAAFAVFAPAYDGQDSVPAGR